MLENDCDKTNACLLLDDPPSITRLIIYLCFLLDKPPELCCSDNQLETLANNMGAPKQFLSRCPSCFQNFVNLFCFTTCHPNSTSFIVVSKDITLSFWNQMLKPWCQVWMIDNIFTHSLSHNCLLCIVHLVYSQLSDILYLWKIFNQYCSPILYIMYFSH